MKEIYRGLTFSLALALLLAAPGLALTPTSSTAPVQSTETEAETFDTMARTYNLSDASGAEHEFTVEFAAATGEVLAISGEEGKDAFLGSEKGTAAALDALLSMVDQGVSYIYVNSDGTATSSNPGARVVNQSAAPSTPDLPDPASYDAVSSFALPDGGRALLFWNEGTITETRVFSKQPPAQQPRLPIEIEINCTITWTPQEGFKINCTVRIRIRDIQIPGINFN